MKTTNGKFFFTILTKKNSHDAAVQWCPCRRHIKDLKINAARFLTCVWPYCGH